MVFGPIDWIVYKMQTKKFDTLQQFVDHCNGGDTICPLRFQFLEKSWIEKYRKPILESFDQSAFLADFVNSSQFMDLACDLDFDNRWWSSEGMVDQNGKTTKWGVAYKY